MTDISVPAVELEALATLDRSVAQAHESAAGPDGTGWPGARRSLNRVVRVVVVGSIAVAAVLTSSRLQAAAAAIVPLLWTLAPLLFLHGLQLLLSTAAWSRLLSGTERKTIPFSVLLRLRVIREGIDSILPIAQIGGEIIASSSLMRFGLRPGLAVGGIIVDMIAELLGQLGYLSLGCLLSSAPSHGLLRSIWLYLGGTFLLIGIALFAARQLGVLTLAEHAIQRIARHVSDIPFHAVTGLQKTVMHLAGDMRAFGSAVSFHGMHWALGSLEVWIVLRAMGLPIGLGQAIVTNAIGVAARSAGIIIPGSLGVQESGFMFGAALAGLPPQAALVFSLIRRLREMAIGGIALGLWVMEPVPCRTPQGAAR